MPLTIVVSIANRGRSARLRIKRIKTTSKQHHSSEKGHQAEHGNTEVSRLVGSQWVSRANARDAWIARVSDEQIVVNLKARIVNLSFALAGSTPNCR